MKVKDIIKKQTTIIAIAVILVAATVIGVSYAIFFDVGKSKDNQVITAGTLKMTISGISTLDLSEPVANEEGLKSSPVSYTVKNLGNLPATYQIFIYADTTNQIALNKVKISLDGTTFKPLTDYTLTTIDNIDYYKINDGEIKTKTPETPDITKTMRLWLDEDLMREEEVGQKVDLNMYIISEVDET